MMLRVFVLACVFAMGTVSTGSAQGFIRVGFGSGFGSGFGPGSFGYGGFGPSFGYGGFGPSLGYGGFGPSLYGSEIGISVGSGYRGRSNYAYAPRSVYSSNYRPAPVYRSAPVYRPTIRYQNSNCNCRRY